MIHKPWDIKTKSGHRPDDAFILPLWKDFTPKDFFFATISSKEDINTTLTYIVPKEFYTKNGIMFHDSMPITRFLPLYFEEMFEGVYEAENVSEHRVRKDLLLAGFVVDHFFSQFVESNSIFAGTF